jgi:hypothetical protein
LKHSNIKLQVWKSVHMTHVASFRCPMFYVNLNVNVKLELTLDYEKFTKLLWVPEYRRTREWWTKKWDRFFWENCHPVATVFMGICDKCKHIWLHVKDMTLTQHSPHTLHAEIIISIQYNVQKKGKLNKLK